jgi:flagellar basal body L-ring protein FlgH
MRFKFMVIFIVLALSFSSAVFGQQTQPSTTEAATATPAAPAPAPAAANDKLVLKDGSDVHLKFAESISSKTAAEGDTINLVLDEDLKVGDVVVAKAGSKAVGTVTHAKKAGMMGKAGEFNMRLEYLKVGDDRVKIRGSKGKEGEGKEGTAVALTVLFGPIGLIKHGKNVDMKEGTPLTAFLDQDYTIPAAK